MYYTIFYSIYVSQRPPPAGLKKGSTKFVPGSFVNDGIHGSHYFCVPLLPSHSSEAPKKVVKLSYLMTDWNILSIRINIRKVAEMA